MTLYGESEEQFRPRPNRVRLALLAIASTVLAAWLAALLSNLVTQVATGVRLVGRTGIPLALYPAGPQEMPGMAATIDPARMALTPLLLLVLATLLLTLWPSSNALAARLSVTFTARTFTVFALAESLATSPAEWLSGDLSPAGLWKPVVAIVCVILLWRSEWSLLQLLSLSFPLHSPSRRLLGWASTSLPQWLVWLLMAGLQTWAPAALAALIAGVVTLGAGAGMRQPSVWEKIDRPRMVEDTLVAVIAAIAVSAAGYATFGASLFGPRYALILSSSPVAQRVELREARVAASPDDPETPIGSAGEPTATATDGDEAVIDIRWSDPAKTATPPAPTTDPPPAP